MDQAAIQLMIDAAIQATERNLQQQLQAAQNDLRNAQTQINVLNANIGANAPAVPGGVTFAYTPGTMGTAATLINYNTTSGAKIQRAAIEKLSVEHDFDKEHLYDFLETLRSRAIACNWYGTLFQIPQDGTIMNPIINYGVITKQAVDTKVRTYMFHNTREAQDDYNLFCCLEASLTNEARATLYAESDMYTYIANDVENTATGVNQSEQRRSGLMYLWAIVNRTTAMTTATISVLLEQLNNLPSLMQEVNNDVTAFNSKVRKLLTSYYANKRETYNETALLHNIAKAYGMCKDEEFVMYMHRKWSDHEDNTRILNSQQLMELALKKYQTSVEEHTWGVDSKQTKTIMSLASKVGNIQRYRKTETENVTEQTKDNSATRISATEYRKKRYDEAPAWMKKGPKDSKETTKNVKGVEYTWCKFHKMWVKHGPATCRLNPTNKRLSNNATNNDKSSTKSMENATESHARNPTTSTVRYNATQTMVAAVHEGWWHASYRGG